MASKAMAVADSSQWLVDVSRAVQLSWPRATGMIERETERGDKVERDKRNA